MRELFRNQAGGRGRTIAVMYTDAKESLRNILDWLAGADETGWERQIEIGEQCRSDMERMARPIYGRTRGRSTLGPQRDPNAGKLDRAIPHVRAMLHALQSRNRAAALEHARAALGVM